MRFYNSASINKSFYNIGKENKRMSNQAFRIRYSNIFNLTLNDTQGKYAVEADLNELCAETKTTIVENSSIGLHRDLVNLEYFSEKCGVNIIVGTGMSMRYNFLPMILSHYFQYNKIS